MQAVKEALQAQGGITHAGNAHLRHMLGEAAWHERHRPWLNKRLKKLLPTLPAGVAAIAWKAQERLPGYRDSLDA